MIVFQRGLKSIERAWAADRELVWWKRVRDAVLVLVGRATAFRLEEEK